MNKPIRILFLNSEYPPLGGGAGRANKEIFAAFAQHEHIQIDCVTSSVDNVPSRQFPHKNITIHRVPIGNKIESLHRQYRTNLLRYIKNATTKANELMSQHEYDVIHAFFTVPAGYVAKKLHKQSGIPYIISLRGSDVPGYNSDYKLIYATMKPLFKNIWKHAASVVANSNQLAQLAHETAPSIDIPIITNGIDNSVFFPADTLPPSDSEFRIITVSRLIQRKRIDLLLRAIASLKEQLPQLRLTVVGDGPLHTELEQLAVTLGVDTMVTFTGRVSHTLVPDLYRNSHLFVLPSSNEGMTNAALEARACGLPLILTDTGDAETLTRDCGLTVPVGNQSRLAGAIRDLAVDTDELQRIHQRARSTGAQYTWSAVADQYHQLYKQIRDK